MSAKALPMDKLKAAMLAVALVSAALIAADADARGRHHHHHHHRGASVGFFFGAPLFYPYYYPHYYPRYYYPPAVLVPAPSSSPVYIEQSPGAAAPAPSSPAQASGAYWYFCRDTRTY